MERKAWGTESMCSPVGGYEELDEKLILEI